MQDDHLFVGTIEDNISFFDPQHDAQRVQDCARLAMVDQEIDAMPMQFNTIVGSLGMALSGGQRSRVLLARALYRRPQILFLDETFDQLDLAKERAITDGLRKTGIGLVIVSHRPETVGAVDRIVRLGEVCQQPQPAARRRTKRTEHARQGRPVKLVEPKISGCLDCYLLANVPSKVARAYRDAARHRRPCPVRTMTIQSCVLRWFQQQFSSATANSILSI